LYEKIGKNRVEIYFSKITVADRGEIECILTEVFRFVHPKIFFKEIITFLNNFLFPLSALLEILSNGKPAYQRHSH